jgi:hypothetical protein
LVTYFCSFFGFHSRAGEYGTYRRNTGGTSRNCRFHSAYGDAEDAAKSSGGERRAERCPEPYPAESHPAAGDVDRDGDLRIVAYVADRRATDQPRCADIERLSDLQFNRIRLILRKSVAEHREGAEEDHYDAGHKRSCPYVPPHWQGDTTPSVSRGAGPFNQESARNLASCSY